jgi:hypothetical protein
MHILSTAAAATGSLRSNSTQECSVSSPFGSLTAGFQSARDRHIDGRILLIGRSQLDQKEISAEPLEDYSNIRTGICALVDNYSVPMLMELVRSSHCLHPFANIKPGI